jgi:predicted nuclease of restriction endonuclease-like (RecB) superfamily
MKKEVSNLNLQFYRDVKKILTEARKRAYRAVNFALVEAYWNIGRRIVEEEQKGKRKAGYGAYLLRSLSERLTKDFGKGFDERNLFYMRQFYLSFPKLNALRSELSWTHYRLLMRVENKSARDFYIEECAKSHWSTRQLERQINSFYYERLLSSKNKLPVKREADKRAKELKSAPEDQIKDPYVLEFLGIQDKAHLRESELEQALISHLQSFLLELGRGFSFVARQKHISTETEHFYIDLVFYNYLLKCFVLIDLKTGKLTHQDIGQMDMYVRIFEDKIKQPTDNPTIGIILCTEKDEVVVKYSVLRESKKLFASKYKLYLPSEKELRDELEREKHILTLKSKDKRK